MNRPAPRGTVRVLGYASTQSPLAAVTPFGALDQGQIVLTREPSRWTVWGAGYGGSGKTLGDSGFGSHDRSTRTYGFASGAEYRVAADTKVGFALAGGGSRFGLADGFGSGRSDMIQAAVYTKTDFGAAYVSSALAYAWHDVSTSRDVMIGGDHHLMASFHAHDIAGQIETGYRLGWFAPFAALGIQSFRTPAYSERPPIGASIFALNYDAQSTTTTRTQLGVRINATIADLDGVILRLRARASWAHDFGGRNSASATFQALPGAGFTVYGAGLASNSLLLSAGPELRFENGLSVGVAFDSQLARGTRSYNATGQLRYSW